MPKRDPMTGKPENPPVEMSWEQYRMWAHGRTGEDNDVGKYGLSLPLNERTKPNG